MTEYVLFTPQHKYPRLSYHVCNPMTHWVWSQHAIGCMGTCGMVNARTLCVGKMCQKCMSPGNLDQRNFYRTMSGLSTN